MNKVKLIKLVHHHFASISNQDIFMEIDLKLPFIPTKEIYFSDSKCNISELAEEIIYRIDTKEFNVYVSEDKELYNATLHNKNIDIDKRFAEIIKEYERAGWKKRKKENK